VGDELRAGSPGYEAIRIGKRVVKKVPKEVIGVPHIGVGYPIIDEGKIVGCVAVALSEERYENIVNAGQEVLAAVQEILASTEGLSNEFQNILATTRSMVRETRQVDSEIENIDDFVHKIKSISMQTNILGLNAAIESARVGELGRGFAVVADEVRKLADDTKLLTTEIVQILSNVKKSVSDLLDNVEQFSNAIEDQAIGTQEVTQTVGQIAEMAEKMVELGQIEN